MRCLIFRFDTCIVNYSLGFFSYVFIYKNIFIYFLCFYLFICSRCFYLCFQCICVGVFNPSSHLYSLIIQYWIIIRIFTDSDFWEHTSLTSDLSKNSKLEIFIYKKVQRMSEAADMGRCDDIQTALKPFTKLKLTFITVLWLAELFKTMNRPDLAWPDGNALWRLISLKISEIETWNFNTNFIQVFNLCY